MANILRFEDSTQFVKHVVERSDKNPDTIVGLGIDFFSFPSSGAWISGYFYKNGHFYDYFTIYKKPGNKHGRLGGSDTANSIIKSIRKVTDQFYYDGGRTKRPTKQKRPKKTLAELFE